VKEEHGRQAVDPLLQAYITGATTLDLDVQVHLSLSSMSVSLAI
jgi:hypothetical protein